MSASAASAAQLPGSTSSGKTYRTLRPATAPITAGPLLPFSQTVCPVLSSSLHDHSHLCKLLSPDGTSVASLHSENNPPHLGILPRRWILTNNSALRIEPAVAPRCLHSNVNLPDSPQAGSPLPDSPRLPSVPSVPLHMLRLTWPSHLPCHTLLGGNRSPPPPTGGVCGCTSTLVPSSL